MRFLLGSLFVSLAFSAATLAPESEVAPASKARSDEEYKLLTSQLGQLNQELLDIRSKAEKSCSRKANAMVADLNGLEKDSAGRVVVVEVSESRKAYRKAINEAYKNSKVLIKLLEAIEKQ